jgi:hypothetical protein
VVSTSLVSLKVIVRKFTPTGLEYATGNNRDHFFILGVCFAQNTIWRDPFREMGDSQRSDDDSVEEVPLTAGSFRRPVSCPKHWGGSYRIFTTGITIFRTSVLGELG